MSGYNGVKKPCWSVSRVTKNQGREAFQLLARTGCELFLALCGLLHLLFSIVLVSSQGVASFRLDNEVAC
jgi:hypothetical protein